MKQVRSRLFTLMLVIGSALITGCATKFEKQVFNGEAAAGIKKVTVSQWNDQEEYRAAIINHPGGSFGLIGLAIAAADTNSKTQKLNAVLNPKTTKVTSSFYEKALPALTQLGYEVIAVPAKRTDKLDDVKATIRKPQGQDASLDLSIESSYLAAGASTGYFPSVIMSAELTDAKSKAVLYRETYHYGYNDGSKDVVHLDAASDCKFDNIDALTANIEKTRSCLLASVDMLVKQLVSDLKK
jgi:hypothetical protein